jgi:hypothetical protein
MAYQQHGGRIEIIIRKEDTSFAGANENEATEAVGNNSDVGGGAGSSVGGVRGMSRSKHIMATHTLATAHQVYDLTTEYVHSGIGVRNGDQAMQQQIQRKVEVFQDVSNMATSVVMGASYGAVGGPVGALVGATLGLVRSATSTAFKYASRQREYDYTIFKEQNAIEYQRARAGINWTSGRLR